MLLKRLRLRGPEPLHGLRSSGGRDGYTPAQRSAVASSSSTRPPAYLQIPDPPGVAPLDVPPSTTTFSTVQSDVRAGAT